MRAVLERDFVCEASRPRTVVLRSVLAFLVAATLVLTALAQSGGFRDNPDEVGAWLFRTVAGVLLGMIVLLAPPVVVGSVLAERQQETLPIVLATPIGPYRFALAKLLSRAGLVATLAAAALPALMLTTVFGGVTGGQVLNLALLAAGVTLELTAWSLWFSTASRRLATALVLSYLVPAARWVVTILFVGRTLDLVQDRSLFRTGALLGINADSTPVPGLVEVMAPGALRSWLGWIAGDGGGWDSVAGFCLASPALAYLLVSLVAAAAAVAAAGRRLRFESEPKESWIARTRLGRRWFRRGSPGRNPVTWKEVRLLNTAGSRILFYAVLALLLLIECLSMDTLRHRETTLVILVLEVMLLCLLCAANGAAILGQERTQGSYDLLRASMLTPDQILRGKAAGVFAGLALLGVVPIGHAVLAVWQDGIGVRTALAVAALVVLFPWGWAVLGMASATHSPRVRGAVLRTMAGFAVCLLGLPLAGLVLLALGGWFRDPWQQIGGFIASGSPPACLFMFLEGLDRGRFTEYWRPRDEETFGLFWVVTYLVLAGILTATLRRRFVRALERDREAG